MSNPGIKPILGPRAVGALKNEALYMMQSGRKQTRKRINRSIKRFLRDKGGAKKISKIAFGAAIGSAAIAVGVATSGVAVGAAAVGVVIGIAAGEFALSKMKDTAFAALAGREYTGAKKTAAFIKQYQGAEFEPGGESQRLASRAHKTIRRACQHYRKAHQKIDKLKKLDHKGPVKSCDDGAERLTLIFQAKHHLDKALLYIHPAFYLSDALFQPYNRGAADWMEGGREKTLDGYIKEVLGKHQGACSDKCYASPNGQTGGPFAITDEDLWDHAERGHILHELTNTHHTLQTHFNVMQSWGDQILQHGPSTARALYKGTVDQYSKRSIATRGKHFFANSWARKTKSEKISFGASQALSVAMSAGGAGLHLAIEEPLKHAVSEALLEPVKMLIEYAQQGLDIGGDIGIDEVAEASARKAKRKSSPQGTGEAREGQECIQNAAIHLRAAMMIELPIKSEDWEDIDNCEDALNMMSEWYKFKHHLWKTQIYLEEAIKFVTECVNALDKDFPGLRKSHDNLCKQIVTFVGKGNHGNCKVCYLK